MLIIKDEATQIASFRTGKLDLMMGMNWKYVDELKKSIPQLQWMRSSGHRQFYPGPAHGSKTL